MPRTTIHDSTNPHQVLDYTRFVSDSAVSFCKMQSDIIRKYKKSGDFITTNGMFGNLDNHRMADECLDVYTYDSYPNFAYCLCEEPKNAMDLNDRKWSRNLTEVRSVCPHFGIMEQQSGQMAGIPEWKRPPRNQADDSLGYAEYCSRCRLCQLFPLENGHHGHRDILAWYPGL